MPGMETNIVGLIAIEAVSTFSRGIPVESIDADLNLASTIARLAGRSLADLDDQQQDIDDLPVRKFRSPADRSQWLHGNRCSMESTHYGGTVVLANPPRLADELHIELKQLLSRIQQAHR